MLLPESVNHEIFTTLRDTATELDQKAYVIGGFVRDYFLGKDGKDIDIVTLGSGITLAEAFAKKINAREVVVYKNFGTALVKHEDYEVEFVGARKESYNRNSRKPIVESGTLEDDQLRRDFTINALSISLNVDDFGMLHDPFGGIQDLQNKTIKTPTNPNITFSDDPLRMMRAVRFATQLDFYIEENTYKALSQNAERLSIISQERIIDELNKIVRAKTPSKGFKLLFNTGLLQKFFPEFCKLHGVESINGRAHKDNFYHTLQVLDNTAEISDNIWLRWAAILHDIAKPATKRFHEKVGWTFHNHEELGARWTPKIFRKLKLPLNERMRYVQKLVRLHLRPIALVDGKVTDSAIRRLIVDAGEDMEDLLKLCWADITTRNDGKKQRYRQNIENLKVRIAEVEERDNLRNFQPPVDGQTIMETYNLKPGKVIGLIKEEIKEAILEGNIPNEESAALAFMHEIAPKYLNTDE